MQEEPNKQTNLSTSSWVCPESPGDCEHKGGMAMPRIPGRSGHGEEGKQEEGGVEQGEQVRVGACPAIIICS